MAAEQTNDIPQSLIPKHTHTPYTHAHPLLCRILPGIDMNLHKDVCFMVIFGCYQ